MELIRTNDLSVSKVDSLVSVETPEQIQFTFELAGPSVRVLAYLIDLSIRGAGGFLIALIIMASTGWVSRGLAGGLVLILLFIAEWGYYTLFEWLWHGYTPGKKAVGIRVVRTDGIAVDVVRAALRNLLRVADLFPFGYATAFLVMFITGTHRRLGDLAADTMVIRESRVRLRELPVLPEQAVEISAPIYRQLRLTDADIVAIDAFFRRYQLFSAERAEELADILVEPLAPLIDTTGVNSVHLLAGVLRAAHETRNTWAERISSPPAASTTTEGVS